MNLFLDFTEEICAKRKMNHNFEIKKTQNKMNSTKLINGKAS